MTQPSEDRAALLACPFCLDPMVVREHSAFHSRGAGAGGCLLADYELDETDYAAWNTRARTLPAAPGWQRRAAEEIEAFPNWADPLRENRVDRIIAILSRHFPGLDADTVAYSGPDRRVGVANRRVEENEQGAFEGGYRRHSAGGMPWAHDRRSLASNTTGGER